MTTGKISDRALNMVLSMLYEPNAIICEIMLASGLRVGDVISLRREQLEKKSFTITEQKTGKKRRVRLPEALRRRALDQSGAVFVFEHRINPDKHRTRQAVYNDIQRVLAALERAGYTPTIKSAPLGKKNYIVGTHSFRKNAVSVLSRSGVSLSDIQELLNHDRVETTLIYLLAAEIDFKARRQRTSGLDSD